MAGFRTPGPIGLAPTEIDRGTLALTATPRPGTVGSGELSSSSATGIVGFKRPTLSYGSRGAVVRELQQRLNAAGAAPPLDVDGIWGRLTDSAVRRFQSRHPPLRVDSIVGPKTWRMLYPYRPLLRIEPAGGAPPQAAKAPPAAAPTRLPNPPPPKPADDPKQLTLVSVGFTDKENANALFGGTRAQYVNLSKASVLPVGTKIPSVNQLNRTPPVAIKVTPPTSTAVQVRLVREAVDGQFPAGSKSLSARETGLDSQTWESEVQTVQTDGSGELLIQPGLKIAVTGGFSYRVQANLPGQAVVKGSNAVTVKRRIYVQPIVHYAAGRSSAMSAIDAITSYLAGFDIDVVKLLSIQGDEFGVVEQQDLPKTLLDIGGEGLTGSSSASATAPHCIAVIVGEFVAETIETVTFKADISKPFKNSITMSLARGSSQYVLVPLSNGKQVVRARVLGSEASKMAGTASESTGIGFLSDLAGIGAQQADLPSSALTGIDAFSTSITVDLKDVLSSFQDCDSIRLMLELRALRGWAVGWAYTEYPVIYLNFRDPNTNGGGILPSVQAQALVVHELGHKLHLASDGSGNLPDKQAHHYPTFSTPADAVDAATMGHRGPHCSTGVSATDKIWSKAAHRAASCTMWGQLKSSTQYCPECLTSIRKVDLSGGF